MVFSIEFCSPTAFKGIVLPSCNLLGYGVTFGYLCDGHAASAYFGEYTTRLGEEAYSLQRVICLKSKLFLKALLP